MMLVLLKHHIFPTTLLDGAQDEGRVLLSRKTISVIQWGAMENLILPLQQILGVMAFLLPGCGDYFTVQSSWVNTGQACPLASGTELGCQLPQFGQSELLPGTLALRPKEWSHSFYEFLDSNRRDPRVGSVTMQPKKPTRLWWGEGWGECTPTEHHPPHPSHYLCSWPCTVTYAHILPSTAFSL